VAYEDWPEEFQELWNEIESTAGLDNLSAGEYELAEYMFEEGFMRYSGEIPPQDIEFAREQFFDIIGEEYEAYFDWEGWREAMGYE
jgi:hypothetical protein